MAIETRSADPAAAGQLLRAGESPARCGVRGRARQDGPLSAHLSVASTQDHRGSTLSHLMPAEEKQIAIFTLGAKI